MSNSEEALSAYASARHIAAAAIRAHIVVREYIVEHASQLTSDNRYQVCNCNGVDRSMLQHMTHGKHVGKRYAKWRLACSQGHH